MTLVVVIARERSDRGNLFNRQPCPITNYSTQTVVVEAGPRLAQGLTAEPGGLETRPYKTPKPTCHSSESWNLQAYQRLYP